MQIAIYRAKFSNYSINSEGSWRILSIGSFSLEQQLTEEGGLVAYLCPDMVMGVKNVGLMALSQSQGRLTFVIIFVTDKR